MPWKKQSLLSSPSLYAFLLIDFDTHHFCTYDCFLIGAATAIGTYREQLGWDWFKKPKALSNDGKSTQKSLQAGVKEIYGLNRARSNLKITQTLFLDQSSFSKKRSQPSQPNFDWYFVIIKAISKLDNFFWYPQNTPICLVFIKVTYGLYGCAFLHSTFILANCVTQIVMSTIRFCLFTFFA